MLQVFLSTLQASFCLRLIPSSPFGVRLASLPNLLIPKNPNPSAQSQSPLKEKAASVQRKDVGVDMHFGEVQTQFALNFLPLGKGRFCFIVYQHLSS